LTPEFILEVHSRLFAADCRQALGGAPAHNRLSTQVLPALMAASIVGVSALAPGNNEARGSDLRAVGAAPAVLETPPPLLLRNLTREEAIRTNRMIAFSRFGNVPAPSFHFTGDKTARARALSCLTAAVYYEAASESEAGQEAVAQVVLNRARNAAFPASICAVVFQGSTLPTGCQFSFTCDGSLERIPMRSAWKAAQDVAEAALSGRVFAPVGLSTHYHADYVVPYWATTLLKDAQVGAHIFYTWPRTWQSLNDFSRRYPGREPDPGMLRMAALMAHGALPALGDGPVSKIEVKADPQVEMMGIVAMLGRESADSGDYGSDAKTFFSSLSQHSAVRLLQPTNAQSARAAKRPDGAALQAALQDFAQDSDFNAFFESHRHFYRAAVDKAQRDASAAVATWEHYTAVPVGSKTVSIAIGFGDESTRCLARSVATQGHLWFRSSTDSNSAPADTLIDSGLSRGLLTDVPPALQEQIIRAVFARAAALTTGADAGDDAVRHDVARGYALVPELARRLREYETNRARYATLAQFLPVLIGNLPAAAPAPSGTPAAAAAPAATDCSTAQRT